MSNILAVQDSNNDLGIGTNSINLISTENFKFIDNNNNTYLEFNTSNNTVGVGTVKQSTWNATPISITYGGTGLTQINGTANQLLSVKSDRSGLEFTNNLMNIKTVTNIAHLAQSKITIGNINYGFNLNSSNNFKINSTPTNNQVLGYKDKTVKFIDENDTNTTDDLWSIMNIFYPGYKYLLMNLTIQKKDTTVNLIEFTPTKYNYTVTVVNTSPIITIKPEVFNDSTIQLRHDVNLGSLSEYEAIITNTKKNFTLTSETDPSGIITRNFNFKIASYDSQIYTLQVLQKVITVTITGYKDELLQNQLTVDYYNGPVYIEITFSHIVIDFDQTKIIKIPSFDSFNITNFKEETGGLIYSFKLTPTDTSESTCKLKINSGVATDNQQNVNRESDVFSFTYDIIHPTMEITAFSDENLTNSISDNTLTNLSKIYLKFTPSEETANFISSSITYKLDNSNIFTNSDYPLITNIDNTNNFKNELNFTNDGTYSIEVEQNKFNDLATNNNNNPSNKFNIRIDTTPPTVTIILSPSGPYKQGDSITITTEFSELIANNTPQIEISGAGNTINKTSMTKVDDDTYKYDHIVSSGNGTATITISDATDLAGNEMVSNSSTTFEIDTTSPTVTDTTAVDGTYIINDSINIDLTFSEAVIATNAKLNLSNGGETNTVTKTASNNIRFSYTVQQSDTNTNNLSISSYTGEIKDLAGNSATAISESLGSVIIDATPPTVIDTTVVDGTYTINDSININLTFSEHVIATNAKLNLSNGAETNTVTKTASNNITFSYTVQQSDTNTNNLSISSYTGEIKDLAGNNATAISESLESVIINISNNTTPDKIIIKYNNNEEIVTLNSELSNTEHTIFDQNTNTTDIMNIDVHRDGKQQVHFIKTSGNSDDENDSRGTTNISNIEFFSNNTDSTSNKNINLKNNCGTYRIVLKITAENGDEQLYKINIIKLIYFGLDPNIVTTQSIISNILPNYYTQSMTNITYKLQCVYSYSNSKRPYLSPYIGPGESSHYTNFVGEAEGSNPNGPGSIETKSRIGRSLIQYKLTDIIRADDNALYANIVHITDNVAYNNYPHYHGAHIHWDGVVYSDNGFMDNNGNIQSTRSVNLAQHLDSNGNYNNEPDYPHDFNNYNSVTKRRWTLPIYNNHSKYNNIFRVKLHYQDSAGTFAIQNIGGGNALGSNSGNLSSDDNFISLLDDSWDWSSDLSLIDAVLWKSGTFTTDSNTNTNTEGTMSIISDLKQKWEFIIPDTIAPTVQTNGITVTSGIKTYIYSPTNSNDNIVTIKITFTENVNANSNAYLNLSNNGIAYIDTTSIYTNTDNLIFKYTINSSSSNSYNLQISSFGPNSNSITDLAGNNCSGISGSLGGVNIVRLSSFGLNNDKNKDYKIKSKNGNSLAGNNDIFITVFQRTTAYAYHWATDSSHPNYGNTNNPYTNFVVTGDSGDVYYGDLTGTNIFKLDNITVDSNLSLLADIIVANNDQAYERNGIGAGVISFATHMDSRYHYNNHGSSRPFRFNQNNYDNTSMDSTGNKRVKIAQSGSDYTIQNIGSTTSAGNKYLELNNLWSSGNGTSNSIDPALWGNGTGVGDTLTNYRFWNFIEQ